MEHPRPVVVLDFGSQYTQLIARRIREMQVYALIVPCHIPFDELRGMNPLALVLSGGPSSVYDPAAPVCDERVLAHEHPGARCLLWAAVDFPDARGTGGTRPAPGIRVRPTGDLPLHEPSEGHPVPAARVEQPRRPCGGSSAGIRPLPGGQRTRSR